MTEQLEIQLNGDQNPNDSKLTQDQINRRIGKVCVQFRGIFDASDYKDYILIMLFLKYVSDVWQNLRQQLVKEYGDEPDFIDEMMQQERFIVPNFLASRVRLKGVE